jgi:eukaryotic-like serine/threonine-protein kinase
MLVGQQLGPFSIDKELGAGAMGAVYRGRYNKTGQVYAIKVMAPGLGDTNAAAADRFEREARILKRLNHPNITRLFAVGREKSTRYIAMEYVEGESLDKVMARRGRMTWEEVVSLGQQLCAALQHAHEAGVVHRDLKPSNIMILPDGTLKLTDFGIAKGSEMTQLTAANCTVGTASYMSPEQCKGERDLTHKSDLYSMGVLFYELVTGRKPFYGESAMDMFVQHVQGTFERPSRIVLDIPVWLDTLVCQLLEKRPEQRPRDAAMVYAALGSIQEKVEAQQSAGLDAARARMIDRPRGQARPGEQDKEAARNLLAGKVRVKRKRKERPLYRQVWFQAVGLLLVLLGVVLALWVALRPPSADRLYQRAEKLMAAPDYESHDKARSGPIKQYLAHYRDRPGPQTEQIKQWADQVEVEGCEQLLHRYRAKKNSAIKFQAQSDTEQRAFAATDFEDKGDVKQAAQAWQEIAQGAQGQAWGLLAGQHLQALKANEALERDLLADLRIKLEHGREPQLSGPAEKALTALRYEKFGDLEMAERRFQELKKEADQPGQRAWFLLAARKAEEVKRARGGTGENPEEKRKELVTRAVKAAEAELTTSLVNSRAACLNVVALYGDDPSLKAQVDKARDLLKKTSGQ